MSGCNHDCSSCKENCAERDPASFLVAPHANTHIKKIIGVVSGKGGVGKSLVTSLLAVNKLNEGKKVAILDADITGPSIPKMFGVHDRLYADDGTIYPATSKKGIEMVSANLILDDESDPLVWRGPMIANLVKQFYTDTDYGEKDYMFIDMPPGTGDVALTVFQSIKMDGLIIVTTPQDLVSMIVEKAIKMANMMNIKVLGLVENMSYVKCPKCDEHISIFGDSKADATAEKYGLKVLAKIPLDPNLTKLCDEGKIEEYPIKFDLDY